MKMRKHFHKQRIYIKERNIDGNLYKIQKKYKFTVNSKFYIKQKFLNIEIKFSMKNEKHFS